MEMKEEHTFIVDEDNSGVSLSTFLRKKYSVRMLRSLMQRNAVYVNGKQAVKSYKVRCGDTIHCTYTQISYSFPLQVLFSTQEYMAVYKPHNTHSAHIAGKETPSIEHMVRERYEFYMMCTRLDYGTSGILFIAKNKSAYNSFREYEETGKIKKFYRTIVEGECSPMCIKNKINTSKTKRSRVLQTITEDRTRYTHIIEATPIALNTMHCSMITCTIHKGARHQIRAHLAYHNLPILGDYKYGAVIPNMPFFLHNYCVQFLDIKIEAPFPIFWEELKI